MELTAVPAGKLKCFHMKNPTGGFYQSWITEMPYGVVICGDVTFGEWHVICSKGSAYNIDWFRDPSIHEQYLCEKFFGKRVQERPKSQKQRDLLIAAGYLCALQQKFAQLYLEWEKANKS